jgi:hypothetical protein
MELPPIQWIVSQQLTEEGHRTAAYPYNKLGLILRPEDCRNAVLEESAPFESEFGHELVAPFYDLLWYLNTRSGIFTSHTAFSTEAFRPNGNDGIAAHIVFLSRKYADWRSLEANNNVLNALGNRLANYALQQGHIRGTGEWINLRPIHVDYYCRVSDEDNGILIEKPNPQRGYGCQIEICAMAESRREAAQKWSTTCVFILDALVPLRKLLGWETADAVAPLSKLGGWEPAEPYDHDEHFPFAKKQY